MLLMQRDPVVKLSLGADAELPASDRPVFLFRIPSADEWLQISESLDRIDLDGPTAGTDLLRANIAPLKQLLVGWEHIKPGCPESLPDGIKLDDQGEVVFDEDVFTKTLTLGEISDLWSQVRDQGISRHDEKKSR